jgi:iron complex outermembrane receptor protein
VLQEDANQLQEVVVQVGYGTVRKKDATGAVAVLGTKDFNKGANVTVENLLSGRIAGVTINSGGGAPGTGTQIRIRGGSSLFANNDPLIVVDGLPLLNTTNTGSTSFLGGINPNDIESFTVLKDASATAIYGSRASNGVIIITTKRGSKTLSVDYNFQYGSGHKIRNVDVFGAGDFRDLIATYQPGFVGQLGEHDTNWQDEIYRRTDYVDHNISLRGNLFNVIPARLSVGNTYQEGLRLTNDYTRNTISTALNPSFFQDHLKMRVNANYTNERSRFADGVEGTALLFDPTQPVYDATSPFGGYFEYYGMVGDTPVPTALAPRNPVAQLMQTNDHGFNDRFYGNFEVDYKFHFLPELRGVVNVGYDQQRGKRIRLVHGGNTVASSPSNGDVFYGTDETSERLLINRLLDAYLVYNKKFDKLSTEFQAGYSYQRFDSKEFKTNNINSPTPVVSTNDIKTPRYMIGFFGRANLSYDDKYLLTLSYRRDGVSRFGPDYRWSNFPAAAFAWKLKEEFFKDSKTVSDMKLRLGYGITGQQDIGEDNADDWLQVIQTGNNESQYYFGPTPYPLAISQYFNPALKWEETTTYNVGFDLGLFDRVNATLDVFYKLSQDLLIPAAIADGSNFSNAGYQNIGDMSSKGVEVGINADIIKRDKLTWNLNFTFTKFERRIDELALDTDIFVNGGFGGTGTTVAIHSEGWTPNSFFLYKQLYDTNGQPIEGAFADLNGDGIITDSDRYIRNNPDPDATFGLASNLTVGNFDFSFNARASVGNYVYNAVDATKAQYGFLNFNGFPSNLPTGVADTNFLVNNNGRTVLSDNYIEDGSFLRVDNITAGYTFPKFLNDSSSLRLSFGVQNAFILTKYSGLDPEINNNGIDNTIYPRQRTYLFGANVKF